MQHAQYYRAKSEYTHAIEFAQKVLATDAANEKAYQHLLFCLAATGDRIGALKQYDECAITREGYRLLAAKRLQVTEENAEGVSWKIACIMFYPVE